jgi:hypothetical protein
LLSFLRKVELFKAPLPALKANETTAANWLSFSGTATSS